nr:hypothetical protein [Vallitaleaceae bacterium]
QIYNDEYTLAVNYQLTSSHAFEIVSEMTYDDLQHTYILSLLLLDPIKEGDVAVIELTGSWKDLAHKEPDNHPGATPHISEAYWGSFNGDVQGEQAIFTITPDDTNASYYYSVIVHDALW